MIFSVQLTSKMGEIVGTKYQVLEPICVVWQLQMELALDIFRSWIELILMLTLSWRMKCQILLEHKSNRSWHFYANGVKAFGTFWFYDLMEVAIRLFSFHIFSLSHSIALCRKQRLNSFDNFQFFQRSELNIHWN